MVSGNCSISIPGGCAAAVFLCIAALMHAIGGKCHFFFSALLQKKSWHYIYTKQSLDYREMKAGKNPHVI